MAKQYRSKGKEILISYFRCISGECFCAKDIMEYLSKQCIPMNQATVYRNLEKMVADRQLIKYRNPNDENCYYQYVGDNCHCRDHLHIRCKKCGQVKHLEGAEMESFYRYLETKVAMRIEPTESILIGVCKECIQQECIQKECVQ